MIRVRFTLLNLALRSIIPDKPQVALEAVKLMAAVCLVPPDGHDATLAAITDAGDIKDLERFQPIAQGILGFQFSDRKLFYYLR